MKIFNKALYSALVVSQIGAIPVAFSQAPAAAPTAAPSCDGLQSSAGKFSENHAKRQQLNKKLCEEGGLKKIVDTIREKMKPCEDLGTDMQGKNHGINVDIFYPDVQSRIEKACKVHDNYDKTAQALCVQYGETAAATERAVSADAAVSMHSTQAGDFNKVASLHAAAVPKYKLFAASMRDMGKQIKKEIPGIEDGNDQPMEEAVRRLRAQIASLTKAKRDQISKRIDQRIQVAGTQGDEAAMRLRTKADANRFWSNIVKCEAVAKDAGPIAQMHRVRDANLDKFNKMYQDTMAKSLGTAVKESTDLAVQFDKQAAEHLAAQQRVEQTSQFLGRVDSPNAAMRNVASGGTLLPGPKAVSSVAKGEALLRGRSYEEAETWLRNSRAVEAGTTVHNGQTYRVFHRATDRGPTEWYLPVRQ